MTASRMMRCALAYASRGWRVFPLTPKQKAPLGRLVPHGCLDASTDSEAIDRWWTDEPEAGIGIATGQASGIWVLDIDGPVGAVVWWQWEAQHEAVHTLAQRTGRIDGGRQLLFRWPGERCVKNGAAVLPGIDVRGEGGYIVAAPSVHPSGRRYRWEGKVAVAAAPDALLSLVGASTPVVAHRPRERVAGGTTPYGQRAADELEGELAACGRGGRDQAAFRVAVRLLELELGGELAAGETEAVMRQALRRNGYLDDPRKERGEAGLQRIMRSARNRAEPRGAT